MGGRDTAMRATVLFCVLGVSVAALPQQTPDSQQPSQAQQSTTERKEGEAGKSEACPIEITKIVPVTESLLNNMATYESIGGKGYSAHNKFFKLQLRNVSGKDIRGMKFQAAYYDATEELNEIPVEWNWTKAVKDKREESFMWRNELWKQESLIGWVVWPTKILFEDGSSWQADEKHACSGEFWRDKKHKKVTK